MKLNSKLWMGSALTLMVVTLLGLGCNAKQPTSASIAAPAIDQYTILNITNVTATMNSHIINGSAGAGAQITSYGSPITMCNNAPMTLVPVSQYYNPTGGYLSGLPFAPGGGEASQSYTGGCPVTLATVGFNYNFISTGLTDGYDQYGLHVTGFINDPEDPTYPPGEGNLQNIQIELFPKGAASSYDVSPYQGIEFYIYVSPSDSAMDRVFNAYVEQQVPPGTTGGVCNNQAFDPNLTHCYDGFEYDYTNTAKGQWVLVQKNWGDLKQYGYGSITSPPTFSGTNLQQFGFFSWAEASAGAKIPMTVDFTISGIRFF